MWFSFSTNALIFVTAMILGMSMRKNLRNKSFLYFLFLTGITSLIAAFGHLETLPMTYQKGLLFLSRIVNLFSIFFFVSGTFTYFNYKEKKWVNTSNYGLILIFLCWLIMQNVFSPVMLYGIFGMAIISMSLFVLNYSRNKSANGLMILGLLILIGSAAVFSIFKTMSFIKPADVSHILVALSLVVMSQGFKKMDLYEVPVQS